MDRFEAMKKQVFGFGLFCLGLIFSDNVFAQVPEVDSTSRATASMILDLAKSTINDDDKLARTIIRDQLSDAANLDPTNLEANFLAGDYHLTTDNRHLAVTYFERVLSIDPDFHPELLFKLGRAHHFASNFKTAIEFYNQFVDQLETSEANLTSRPSAKNVGKHIKECNHALELLSSPIEYTITNLGYRINSELPDYAPVFDADEKIMVFTTRRSDGNTSPDVFTDNFHYEDIFIAEKIGNTWDSLKNIGSPINTGFHDSNLALSADGNTLYLYSDENNGDIYFSDRDPDTKEWTEPRPVNGINSSHKENSVSISPDNQLLFFSSDRPGHQGPSRNLDIYVSRRQPDGDWGRPTNLGDNVNTVYDDEGPFIDYDGMTLYFSSKGWNTMGEHDIFKSTFDSTTNTWRKPVNMGAPLNSPDDDIYFVSTRDGRRGYYASARENGVGYLDIYEVQIPDKIGQMRDLLPVSQRPKIELASDEPQEVERPIETVETQPGDTGIAENTPDNTTQPEETTAVTRAPVVVSIKVVDAISNEPLKATPTLTSLATNEELQVQNVKLGQYSWEGVFEESGDFYLNVVVSGYQLVSFRVNLPASTSERREIKRTIPLKKVVVENSYVLKYIYFDFNKATFTDNSYAQLESFLAWMQQNANANVVIAGHTDDVGTPAYNQDLSERRSNAVANFLIEKGINPNRLEAVGFGATMPLASNDDEAEGRELNRRVEFRVVGQAARGN